MSLRCQGHLYIVLRVNKSEIRSTGNGDPAEKWEMTILQTMAGELVTKFIKLYKVMKGLGYKTDWLVSDFQLNPSYIDDNG